MSSEHFFKLVKKGKKELKGAALDFEDVLARLRSHFCDTVSLPEHIAVDLFNCIIADLNITEDSVYEFETTLGGLVDLFRYDLNEEYTPIPDKVWSVVKEVVNEYALKLDQDLLTYIMKYIVEKGLI